MNNRPLRIGSISWWPPKDPNWVWIKDTLNYRYPLEWQFFNPFPIGPIDRFLARPFLGRLVAGLRLRRAVKNGEIDLVVSHLTPATALAGALLGKSNGNAPHIAFAFNFTDLPKGLGGWFMTRSYQNVDLFVVFSEMERKVYSQYFRVVSERFVNTTWAVNPPIDQPGPRQVDVPYIVSMGGEARDYPVLVEVARAMKDTIFVLIVRPQTLDGLELPPNVKVFINVPWVEAWSLVYHAALAVLPLRNSESPNGHITLVGGMHLGKAHVVTDSIGLSDYVTHNETALVVPAGDSLAMQSAIETLLSDRKLAEKIGNSAKIFAQKNCSEEVAAKFFAGLLDRLFPQQPMRNA